VAAHPFKETTFAKYAKDPIYSIIIPSPFPAGAERVPDIHHLTEMRNGSLLFYRPFFHFARLPEFPK
jgi:hypothetical protein